MNVRLWVFCCRRNQPFARVNINNLNPEDYFSFFISSRLLHSSMIAVIQKMHAVYTLEPIHKLRTIWTCSFLSNTLFYFIFVELRSKSQKTEAFNMNKVVSYSFWMQKIGKSWRAVSKNKAKRGAFDLNWLYFNWIPLISLIVFDPCREADPLADWFIHQFGRLRGEGMTNVHWSVNYI